jgi:hypothetical protein
MANQTVPLELETSVIYKGMATYLIKDGCHPRAILEDASVRLCGVHATLDVMAENLSHKVDFEPTRVASMLYGMLETLEMVKNGIDASIGLIPRIARE